MARSGMIRVAVDLTPEEIAQVDEECAAAEKAAPGSRMSRAGWARARLVEVLARKAAAKARRESQ